MEFLSRFFARFFQAPKAAKFCDSTSLDDEAVIRIVGMEFYNRQSSKLMLWIEPDCLEINLDSATEYRIEFNATQYRFEFNFEIVVLYLEGINTVLRIFERPYSTETFSPALWDLTADYSN